MAIETLSAGLQQINRLFAEGSVTGFSDGQLLNRFLAQGDTVAFEALVARHGSMVLSVCRGVLNDPNDAEDAFQATFLVLVKKAGSIRGRDVLGGWLYQVAHRVAIRANVAAARRRKHERQSVQTTVAAATPDPAVRDELFRVLHQEIAGLSQNCRLAVVLCDLEGCSQAEAASRLRWSERTLRRRLAEARQRLKVRLTRRGLASEGGTLGTLLLREARSPVPAPWNQAVVKAATAMVNPTMTAGIVSTTAKTLTEEVLRIMLLQKLRLATAALLGAGLMAWGTSAALVSLGDEPPRKAASTATPPETRKTVTTVAAPEADPNDAVGQFPVRGQVLDPDGKPIANAEIYITHQRAEYDWNRNDPIPPQVQRGRVTRASANGRFQFELDKASSDSPYTRGPAWHKAVIAAVVPGFGSAWIEAGELLKGDEATLRLVRDEIPIRGRILDSQGRPVAGASVRVSLLAVPKEGVNPDDMLSAGELHYEQTTSRHHAPSWLGDNGMWTTGSDGRFEIKGLGQDRIAWLEVEGPGQAKTALGVIARPSKAPPNPRPRPSQKPREMRFYGSAPPPPLFGATFEHIVGPTKPIAGIVRAKETGRPVAGVNVGAIEGTTWTLAYGQTDAQGRFRLVGLPKSDLYQLYAVPRPGVTPFLGLRVIRAHDMLCDGEWPLLESSEGVRSIEVSQSEEGTRDGSQARSGDYGA